MCFCLSSFRIGSDDHVSVRDSCSCFSSDKRARAEHIAGIHRQKLMKEEEMAKGETER